MNRRMFLYVFSFLSHSFCKNEKTVLSRRVKTGHRQYWRLPLSPLRRHSSSLVWPVINCSTAAAVTEAAYAVAISPPATHSERGDLDVFINFRGVDTRENFTSHLYDALIRARTNAFIDTEALEKGEEIGPALFEAISRSKISVVVFSENYAYSRWCLNELVKIAECRRRRGQIVLPVFYHVEPKVVRWQTGSYGAAFARHDEDVVEGLNTAEKVRSWRDALKYVADLSGFHTADIRPESKLVHEVVACVLEKLQCRSSSDEDDHHHPKDSPLFVPYVNLYCVNQQFQHALPMKKVEPLVQTLNTTGNVNSIVRRAENLRVIAVSTDQLRAPLRCDPEIGNPLSAVLRDVLDLS